MELFLNLVWTALAVASFCLWVRHEKRDGTTRCLPLIALVMLLVILFPVISVSDDLWSVQNPAETDSTLRRDQIASVQPSILPSWVAPVLPVVESMDAENRLFYRIAQSAPPRYAAPALDAIENRPPPVA
jgi:hypothetical protein